MRYYFTEQGKLQKLEIASVAEAREVMTARYLGSSSISQAEHEVTMGIFGAIQPVLAGKASVDTLTFNGDSAAMIEAHVLSDKYDQYCQAAGKQVLDIEVVYERAAPEQLPQLVDSNLAAVA